MSKSSAKEKSSADSWLMDLDEGIRYAVRVLDRHGVETYESCQGGDGHAYPVPSVRFHGQPGAGWLAVGHALDYGLPVKSLSRIWTFSNHGDVEPHGPTWQMTFYRQMPDENPVVAALKRLIDLGD